MKTKGFTIVEVLFSISIVAAVSWTVINFAKNVLGLNQSASQSLTAQLEGRKTIKSIVSEVRTAIPSATGAYTIESAATGTLTFFADIDGDGRSERIHYFADTATKTLKRGVVISSGNPSSYNLGTEIVTTLANDLLSTSTPIFEYFDSSYAGTSTPLAVPVDVSRIRLIRVTIFIEKDPNRTPLPMKLTSEVMLRNLKDNL
ncbi:type II secretion system GspH family protein [Candidatus Parcubacteria bacterium]|nr:type II secretion system GspH family protein [Candidatus Parcubacteria bacterium]